MKLDILAFGAHPDDVELSAGGTLARHVALGYKVGIIDLTLSQLSSRGTVENRKKEAEEAAKALGVHVRENLEMEDGYFLNDEAHREKVIRVIRKYRPEIIIANSPKDRHPDHERGSSLVKEANFYAGLSKITTRENGEEQEAWRAKSIYYYIQFTAHEPDLIVDIRGYREQKVNSLKAYGSQFYNPSQEGPETMISSKGFMQMIEGRHAVHGGMAAIFEGEAFLTEKKVAVDDLFKLVHGMG